ncbi:hypothetical protein KUTeg_001226 [Tegillarca granosa]|uniref:Helicase ATP-binding domain-containing protein n=1 Tax=Tegillarca granosa TaxID=220873 RepID=A0ABQ9FVE3_TEGGR|nr:hypothetical protein KUTeg_001226 [Tegillarca granosa]
MIRNAETSVKRYMLNNGMLSTSCLFVNTVNKKYIFIHEEQVKVIQNVISKNDVFCLLKTGFGKSVCFILPSQIIHKLFPDKKHITLVISPFKAYIQDQLAFMNALNVPAMAIIGGSSDLTGIKENITVVLASPEAILLPRWTRLIKQYRDSICLQLIYLMNTKVIKKFTGLDFRPPYRRVSEIQSYITAPTLILTATATSKIQDDIYDVLSLDHKTNIIASIPEWPNIFMDMVKVKDNFKEELTWLVEMLKSNDEHNTCFEIYLWLCIMLGNDAFDGEKKPKKRLIEMFHANADEESKARILETFVKTVP